MWVNSSIDPLADRIVCGVGYVSALKSPTCALTVSTVSTPMLCDYQSSIINDIFKYPDVDEGDDVFSWFKTQGINRDNILYDLSGVNKINMPSTIPSCLFPAGPLSNNFKGSMLKGLFKEDHIFDNASLSSDNFFFFYGECSYTSYNWDRNNQSACKRAGFLNTHCSGGVSIWPSNSGPSNYQRVISRDGGYSMNSTSYSSKLGVYSSLTCPNTRAGLFDKYNGYDTIWSKVDGFASHTSFPSVPILRENPNFRTYNGNRGFLNMPSEYCDILNDLLYGRFNLSEIINFHSKKAAKPYGDIVSFGGSSLNVIRQGFYVDHCYNGDSVTNSAWGLSININDSSCGFNGIRALPFSRTTVNGKEFEFYMFIAFTPNCSYRYVTGILVTSLDGIHYMHIESGSVGSLPRTITDELKKVGNYFIKHNIVNCYINLFSKHGNTFNGPSEELSVRFNNYMHDCFGDIVSFNGDSLVWKTNDTIKPSIKNMSGDSVYTYSDSSGKSFELHSYISGIQHYSNSSLFSKIFKVTPDNTFTKNLSLTSGFLSNLRSINRTTHFLPAASIFKNGVLYSMPDGSINFTNSGESGNAILVALYKASALKRNELVRLYGDDFTSWFSQKDKKALFKEALTATSYSVNDPDSLIKWAKDHLGYNPVTKTVDKDILQKHGVIKEQNQTDANVINKINSSTNLTKRVNSEASDELDGNTSGGTVNLKKENSIHGHSFKATHVDKGHTITTSSSNESAGMNPKLTFCLLALAGASTYFGYKYVTKYQLERAVSHYEATK